MPWDGESKRRLPQPERRHARAIAESRYEIYGRIDAAQKRQERQQVKAAEVLLLIGRQRQQ